MNFKHLIALLLLVLIVGSKANAARIDIQNTSFVKAEVYHQFKAVLYKDDGTMVDVTRDAIWTSIGNRERQDGEFLFPVPTFGSSSSFYARISLTYNGDEGMLSASASVRVDATPDHIRISGGMSTRSGGSLNLRASGSFRGRQVDLTNRGRWSATYGRISNGWYSAPRLRENDRRPVYDRVSFTFGLRRASHSITVR